MKLVGKLRCSLASPQVAVKIGCEAHFVQALAPPPKGAARCVCTTVSGAKPLGMPRGCPVLLLSPAAALPTCTHFGGCTWRAAEGRALPGTLARHLRNPLPRHT